MESVAIYSAGSNVSSVKLNLKIFQVIPYDLWSFPRNCVRPTGFLLHINDLADNLQTSIKLFADDVLLYGVVANDRYCRRSQE